MMRRISIMHTSQSGNIILAVVQCKAEDDFLYCVFLKEAV